MRISMRKLKRNKCLGLLAGLALTGALLTGCGGSGETVQGTEAGASEAVSAEQTAVENTDEAAVTVRIGSLKGPTSMGLLFLKEKAEMQQSEGSYEFRMATGADELLPLIAKGDLDIALVPANVAAVLYQKMQGGLEVIDINTLGVLYMVSGDDSVKAVEDLKGRTIYLTGKGTTPDYVLHYIMEAYGLTEEAYTLEYKSEPTEVAALLAENPDAVGLLPQPFVTAACAQNEALSVILDMNGEWEKLQGEGGGRLVTGVTVVRKAFLEEHGDAVELFLKEHEASTLAMAEDVKKGAELTVKEGIIAQTPIAEKAIPECNITFIRGQEMKQALSGYLDVLFGRNPEAVGGMLPEDDFYYIGQ